MPKKNAHPDYHKITVKMTDGSTYETRSTWGKEGDILVLSVDPLVHSAWTESKGTYVREGGSVQKFQKRFGNISALRASPSKKKKGDPEQLENAEK